MIEAKVLADSQYGYHRVTTMEVTLPRSILAEFNTHRVFSRNTSSSRAIPIKRVIRQVLTNPFVPEFRRNRRGMVAGGEFGKTQAFVYKLIWRLASVVACGFAFLLSKAHKQYANRLLEPWMWAKVIVTSTEWDNFFKQRISKEAEPSMNAVAKSMKQALCDSEPDTLLDYGWHVPLIEGGDYWGHNITIDTIAKLSAARCARVSYLRHNDARSHEEDIKLFDRLVDSGHWSPLEHVVQAVPAALQEGNLSGFRQLRHEYEKGVEIELQ